jgi:hypothetical protein
MDCKQKLPAKLYSKEAILCGPTKPQQTVGVRPLDDSAGRFNRPEVVHHG